LFPLLWQQQSVLQSEVLLKFIKEKAAAAATVDAHARHSKIVQHNFQWRPKNNLLII